MTWNPCGSHIIVNRSILLWILVLAFVATSPLARSLSHAFMLISLTSRPAHLSYAIHGGAGVKKWIASAFSEELKEEHKTRKARPIESLLVLRHQKNVLCDVQTLIHFKVWA
jgi:hypothetical protein